MDVTLKIAGVEKMPSEKVVVVVNLEAIWFDVSDSGDVCPMWLVILKSVRYNVRDTFELQYSWPWAVVSYTLLAAVPRNG